MIRVGNSDETRGRKGPDQGVLRVVKFENILFERVNFQFLAPSSSSGHNNVDYLKWKVESSSLDFFFQLRLYDNYVRIWSSNYVFRSYEYITYIIRILYTAYLDAIYNERISY